MSLNWDISKVDNWEEVNEGEAWSITDALIWATMVVGIRTITEKNYAEFYARVHFVEKLRGAWLVDNGGEKYVTVENIKRRIGLTTNVGTLTRNQFTKRQVDNFFNDILGRTE